MSDSSASPSLTVGMSAAGRCSVFAALALLAILVVNAATPWAAAACGAPLLGAIRGLDWLAAHAHKRPPAGIRRLLGWLRPIVIVGPTVGFIGFAGPDIPGWILLAPVVLDLALVSRGRALLISASSIIVAAVATTLVLGGSWMTAGLAGLVLPSVCLFAAIKNTQLRAQVAALRIFQDRLYAAERARAEATMEAQQASRLAAVGRLAAGVAHEVNNPLTAVLSNIEFLEHSHRALDGVDRGTVRDLHQITDEIHEAAKRIQRIVGDVKAFSRVDHEEQRIDIDTETLLDGSIRMVNHELRHRARLVRDYHDVAPVTGDPARLGQVFVNLLINAAQAIPEGHIHDNEIKVTTRSAGPEDDRVLIEIRDTGVGIPEEYLSRIFEPFFTSKPVGEGTGLGLSIVHGIVARMGGEIEVESVVGRGTTCRILLPCAASDRVQARRPAPTGPKTLGADQSARVLIIDDEPLIVESLARALAPHHVTTAAGGAEALAVLAAGDEFDLILCDLMMPAMSGMEFHRQVTLRFPEAIPSFVMMTGGAFTQEAEAFLDRLDTPLLEKPFSSKEVRRLIEETFEPSGVHPVPVAPQTHSACAPSPQ